MPWTRALVAAVSGVLLAAPPEPLLGQRPPPVQVEGRVVDDATLEPVPEANVVMLDAFGEPLARRIADRDGRFSFEVRNRSAVRFRAERIGYRQATTPVLRFDERTFFSIEILLDQEAVLLAPLAVVARSAPARSAVFSNFDHRVRSGFGSYVTREEIERRQPALVTDLLAQLPGVRLEGAGRGTRRMVVMARSEGMLAHGGACPVQIYLDGRLMTRGSFQDISLDDLVTPEAVEGIEVYRGLSTVPPEFLNENSRCGVVAVWTRRALAGGGEDR